MALRKRITETKEGAQRRHARTREMRDPARGTDGAMKSSHQPSPAELRGVFGTNLRSLVSGEKSVSALCQRIGINRTQFNRYLAGEAFPRPDILYRICSHFDVDARILLEPLESIRRADHPHSELMRLRQIAMRPTARPFDHYMLPDGLYRFWRRSYASPDLYVIGLSRIYTDDDAKLFRSIDLYPTPLRVGTRRFARKAVVDGVFFQHFDGVSLICSTGSENVMNFTFIEYGMQGMSRYYNGLSMVARRQMVGVSRLSAIVFERLEMRCGSLLSAARQMGVTEAGNVPEALRKVLDRVPPQL